MDMPDNWEALREHLLRYTANTAPDRAGAFRIIEGDRSKQQVRLAAMEWLESNRALNKEIEAFIRHTAQRRKP